MELKLRNVIEFVTKVDRWELVSDVCDVVT